MNAATDISRLYNDARRHRAQAMSGLFARLYRAVAPDRSEIRR